jgi:perosamine synthetase
MIRLSKPYLPHPKKTVSLLRRLMRTGFLTQGVYVERFEQELARCLNVRYAVAVSSGTAALYLALRALGVERNDQVVLPAYTFPATANVVELVGARPVFADVDRESYNLDPQQLQRLITKRTKAILPVHLFGNPADMSAIMAIARAHKLAVIEDAAGALGAVYAGKKCGTIGSCGCFSFHPRKIITTAEGGMLVTDNARIAEKARMLRNHGCRLRGGRMNFIEAGFNLRMNELQAVVGLSQVDCLGRLIKERNVLAGWYKKYLASSGDVDFQNVAAESTSVWQALVIRLRSIGAQAVIQSLRNRQVEATVGTYAVPLLEFYSKKYGLCKASFPNAALLYKRVVALPFYNGLPECKIRKVARLLEHILSCSKG